MDPFSLHSPGFVNMLASQSSPPLDVDSAEAPVTSPGLVKPVERRKWSTKEDIVLISAWLNTSKDPIFSNEQKLGSFWKRIGEYFNSSHHLVGSLPRHWSQCKQRWGRVNAEVCRRRFRMNKPLFLRIVERISNEVPYFQQIRNACGRNGLSALQKCTSTIRMLAYGQSGDTYDEYLRLGDNEYLRIPTPEDLQRLLDVILHNMIAENERHGYAQIDTSEFESGESSRSSRVKRRESIHVGDMLGIRREVRDTEKHDRLKADLMENIWQKFGNEDE
uniref:Myb-like domain-containing protein n=1 Tax=Brassica oleracea var. oleracea TaxID=109376 RepID=A0A0D2ZS75_BRAOL